MSDASPPAATSASARSTPRDTYPEQQLDNDLCQAVVAGQHGLPARPGRRRTSTPRESVGDRRSRRRRPSKVMDNIELLLGECGAELEDICKVAVYLTDIRYREAGLPGDGAVAAGRLPGLHRPRGPALARPEWVVEIDATAVIPESGRDVLAGRRAARAPACSASPCPRPARRSPPAARTSRAGVGAVGSQNVTDPRLGPRLLDLLAGGRRRRRGAVALVVARRRTSSTAS